MKWVSLVVSTSSEVIVNLLSWIKAIDSNIIQDFKHLINHLFFMFTQPLPNNDQTGVHFVKPTDKQESALNSVAGQVEVLRAISCPSSIPRSGAFVLAEPHEPF